MKEFSKQSICDGVKLVTVHTDRFKTNEMAISFLLPLTEETAARNALTISLLSNCSEEYPDMLSIKKKDGISLWCIYRIHSPKNR